MLNTILYFLSGIEIWVVGGIVGVSVIDARFLLPACGIAALFWPVRRAAAGRWTVRTPADLPIILLVVMAFVSLRITAIPEITLPQVLRLMTGIGLYYALVNWVDRPGRFRFLLLGTAAAGIGLACFSLVSVDWAQTKLPFIPSSLYDLLTIQVSDIVHPNVLAGNLLLFAIIAAALFVWRVPDSASLWALSGLAALFMAAIIVLSQSRSSLLALALAGLVLLALRWRWGWLGFVLAGVALAWLFFALSPAGILDLFVGHSVLGGFLGRADIWARGIFIIQDFSFTGTGMGLFHPVVSAIYPFFSPDPVRVDHAHNLFLQVGVDLGIPGLVAWLAISFCVASSSWKAWRVGKTLSRPWLSAAGAGVFAAQVAVYMHGIFDVAVWGMVRAAPILWAIWALGIVAGRLADRPGDMST